MYFLNMYVIDIDGELEELNLSQRPLPIAHLFIYLFFSETNNNDSAIILEQFNSQAVLRRLNGNYCFVCCEKLQLIFEL